MLEKKYVNCTHNKINIYAYNIFLAQNKFVIRFNLTYKSNCVISLTNTTLIKIHFQSNPFTEYKANLKMDFMKRTVECV